MNLIHKTRTVLPVTTLAFLAFGAVSLLSTPEAHAGYWTTVCNVYACAPHYVVTCNAFGCW